MNDGHVLEGSDLSEAKRLLLSRRLKGYSASEQQTRRIEARPAGSRTEISVDQNRIWLHASMHPESPTYNEPITLRYRGAFDLDVLEASFNQFLERHEAWRTSFREEQGKVVQVIHPELRVRLALADLSGLPAVEREREAKALATQQAIEPFDLTTAPLFRAFVVRVAPDEHRLYVVLQHIIFDGLSVLRTFLPELAAIYASLEKGQEHELPPRTLQYADYAVWRGQQVALPAMQRSLDYWRTNLAGELPVLQMPSDRPRPVVPNQRGSLEHFVVPRELADRLRQLSRAHGVTLYMTILAVFKILLFRYSGQEDLIVGGVADARRRPELHGMMGYLLDTFAVRTAPSAQLPFSAYLRQVRHAVVGALSAAEAPFDHVVQATCAKRDVSTHPIFQVFLSFLPSAGTLPAGWDLPPMDVTTGATKFDLYLEVDERPGDTLVRFLYSTDRWDAATIRRMGGHWLTLLRGVCDAPDCVLGDLPMVTAAELDLMHVQWNNRACAIPAVTVHGLVEEQARRTPDRTAVEFETVSWTYAQLDRQAELFAARLREAGAAPGGLVAICLDRSENLLAGLLGILKTGAAYLPLDPGVPRARLMLCLEDAAPVVVLTQRSIAHDLPAGGAAMLLLEDVLEDGREVLPAVRLGTPEDVAYVIHTSGSTGRPKAVELRHDSVVNLLLSMQREPGFAATDTLLAVTTVSFDIAVLEFFLPLISGGRVVIASRGVALDPYQLAAMIESTGCSVMQATPATWRALLATDWAGKQGLRVLCGGEALTRDLAQGLLALGVELWNVYGPTETTIWSTAHRVQTGVGPVPIGRPIANTTAYLLDANQQPVPVGVPGELYLGGLGLANGYREQADLTTQKFVTPRVAKGERLYRTGDYAIYRPDGTLECQGRADNQVKVRGYRIELEDVESSLNAHPGVAAAAARIWPEPAGGNRLSAYLVGKNGSAPTVQEMRAFLQARLPHYMVPSDFVVLDALPMTSNGKTDRKALLPPEQAAPRMQSSVPLSAEEEMLARIWSDVFGMQAIGRDDDFFELGGHSLLLVRLFARINKEYASSLPITTIFDTRTIGGLAKILNERRRMSALVPVQTAGSQAPLFMAYAYLLYQGLSSELGNDQPFYGLRELDEDGEETLEQRAIRYMGEMRTVQARGPYRLAGWCATAPLAVEIARQLILAGEHVGMLALFDTWLPGYEEKMSAQLARETRIPYLGVLRAKLARQSAKLRGLSFSGRVNHVANLALRLIQKAGEKFYLKHLVMMNRLFTGLNLSIPQFAHNTTQQTIVAMREMHMGSLPVRLTLVRAVESPEIPGGSEACGWEQIAELGVDVLWAPGDHITMFQGSNLKVTAGLVRQALVKAGS